VAVADDGVPAFTPNAVYVAAVTAKAEAAGRLRRIVQGMTGEAGPSGGCREWHYAVELLGLLASRVVEVPALL